MILSLYFSSHTFIIKVKYIFSDIDECKERGSEICISGSCFNTLGSYECECEPGSALDVSRNICIGNSVLKYNLLWRFKHVDVQ